jgi:hypothetical protein
VIKPGQAVAVLLADEQLGAFAWAFSQAARGAKLGAILVGVQAGATQRVELIGGLRDRGLIAGDLIAVSAAANGHGHGIGDAIEHAFSDLGWDSAVCLSGSTFAADDALGLECTAAAHALDRKSLAVAEMSVVAGGPGHQLSEQTLTLLDLVAEPVTVALPAGIRSPVGRELREGLRSVFDSPSARQSQLALGVDRPARIARHDWRRSPVDLIGFAAARVPVAPGTPALLEDPLIHASALAAGSVLAELLREEDWH